MIKENVLKLKERISLVCSKIKQDPDKIVIVAVSKNRDVEQIKEAIEAGINDIGENRIQEAIVKYNQLQAPSLKLQAVRWHLVGHLQTNKVKEAVRIFGLIHSVDSIRLAQEIDKQAAKINKIQDVLIEVNTSKEETKFGIKPEDLEELVKMVSSFQNIRLKGLMTIAPIVDTPEKARPYFRRLRELLEEVNAQRITQDALRILSMGMTDDFEVAIEEGSHMLRIGWAIFKG